jgi:hypothetical protein
VNHYIVVGAGGTASYLIPALHRYLRSAHELDFLMVVIDGDTVEATNLDRQAHAPDSVGLNKAEALCAGYGNTLPVKAYLGPDNIDQLIREGTTVIITVDNYPCRARIAERANTLSDITIINAGNEEHTGSVQLWKRVNGEDITPPITFLHPEINMDGEDRAAMTCQQVAALPGGGQTALANMLAAGWIMTALNHNANAPSNEPQWHEVHFDALSGVVEPIDYRSTKAWTKFKQSSSSEQSQQPQSSA